MTLEEIVEKCRALGITEFEGPVNISGLSGPVSGERVRILIGPKPAVDAPIVNSVDTNPPEVQASKKRGKDGLTAEEQVDLYGRRIDAE